ncbi:hypothetical protein A3A14_02835 [Candidatus Daviesbacteria bacterium RIFCSPLOWO2_01_FULL_43_38]|uniref:DUF1059 domain-containing protein n=2 Tax=Candidatus Daviesiibacteriota TaxID=1752718 RepID=A0A1F5K7L9_9BACT|nr:MAG: hypothetical protein UV41_C0010G0010 [Candidatus Daviesbacteria bacterium GW2011_GWA2_42_7]OGE19540.1 MAG: hypothetical protein A2874_03420 [Candidatus Daviesbacteria bacterium RIFCSPHIGHO2_01_FULL_43_17]OGE36899.1 MAG: hypothetical protein A3E45_03590 [Candidatus Daviesbacteria bacterium RIFCSPHIGHO2_12_FULL_43_11]OGE63565.1 MAG: hypothetical protein A3A14_02835 [Candidatus Daviesbacteria bacterium RIFCSPLOWO2_01_FULL_43_38]OGE69184.1 MAG: hypothetical protein A3J21_01520 [Candidatus D
MTYSLVCADGHDPETITVEAMGDEEAMTKMMVKSKAHLDVNHSEMASMTEEQSRAFISSHWTKT